MSGEERSNSVGKRKVDDYEDLESRALLSIRRHSKPRIDEDTNQPSINSGPRGDDDTIKSPSYQRIVNRKLFVRNRPVEMSDIHFVEFLNQAMKAVNLCPAHANPILLCRRVGPNISALKAESEAMGGRALNLNGILVPGGDDPLEISRHTEYDGKPDRWKPWDEVKASLATFRKPSRPHRDKDTTESPRRYRSHFRDDDNYESSRSPRPRREEDNCESSMGSRSRVDAGNYESSRRPRLHRDVNNNESPSRRSGPRRVDENEKSSRKNEVSGRRDENTNETRSPSSSEFSNQSKTNRQLLVRNNKLNTLMWQDPQKGLGLEEAKAWFFSREEWQRDIATARGGQLMSSQPQQLFVGNIKPGARKADLLDFLGRTIIQARLSLYAGSPISKCDLVYGPNKIKQYALLEVRTEEETQNMLHLNRIPFMGVKLIVKRRGNKYFNPFSWQALEKKLSREEGLSGNAPHASFKVAPTVREFHLLQNFGGGDYEDHDGQRKPNIERDPIETQDVISWRTSELRKPLVTGASQETSRSTVSAANATVEARNTTVEARKRSVLSAPRKIIGNTATARNTDDTRNTPIPGEAPKTNGSTATVAAIDWETTTVEHQLGKSHSDKRIPDTTKEELEKAREKLDRMMQEAEVLRNNPYLEIRVREEQNMVEEKQKNYEDFMIEYTHLGKDFRRVSSNLLEATEKRRELQEGIMSARQTREEAERVYGEAKVARERIERELEQTLTSWKKEVEELEDKLKQRF
jgi:hypothetical protein